MARNKTKSQKVKSAERRSRETSRLGVVYSLDESHLRQVGKIRSVDSKMGRMSITGNLFSYDPKLLLNDLFKTIVISAVMFAALGAIYFYFNS